MVSISVQVNISVARRRLRSLDQSTNGLKDSFRSLFDQALQTAKNKAAAARDTGRLFQGIRLQGGRDGKNKEIFCLISIQSRYPQGDRRAQYIRLIDGGRVQAGYPPNRSQALWGATSGGKSAIGYMQAAGVQIKNGTGQIVQKYVSDVKNI